MGDIFLLPLPLLLSNALQRDDEGAAAARSAARGLAQQGRRGLRSHSGPRPGRVRGGVAGQEQAPRREWPARVVAIKGVSIRNEQEGATAEREIAILNEMCHPNIIRLLHAYDKSHDDAKGRYMALSYVKGPDLGQLLEERGALGLPLAQLIARHLIAAVAYCHARGVMHRDIKPDNIMLEGCREGKQWVDDHVMWEDCKLPQGRFKAVLADFGFARATSADDYEQMEEEERQRSKGSLYDRRKSRIVLKAKSAVGTKHFSAPEIVGNIRKRHDSEVNLALAPCVSSYALISDAFAVGATLSEITTGVPPGEDVETYVDLNRNRRSLNKKQQSMPRIASPLSAVKTKIKRHFSFRHHHMEPPPLEHLQPYEIQLRHLYELPEPAADLIVWLMMEDAAQRLSVREAQNHEWIGGYDTLPHGDVPSHPQDPMVYIENQSGHI